MRLTSQPGGVRRGPADEVKEVVVNLLENARNAGARVVEVTVGPDRSSWPTTAAGIPADLLPRIFEPRFSTTTSGSGLGLAIVRRLVEGWGGRDRGRERSRGGAPRRSGPAGLAGRYLMRPAELDLHGRMPVSASSCVRAPRRTWSAA